MRWLCDHHLSRVWDEEDDEDPAVRLRELRELLFDEEDEEGDGEERETKA